MHILISSFILFKIPPKYPVSYSYYVYHDKVLDSQVW